MFIPIQLHTPTSAVAHLLLEVVQSFWLIWTVLERNKLFWTAAAATAILTAIPTMQMYGCGVSTDDTSIQVKYTIHQEIIVSLLFCD